MFRSVSGMKTALAAMAAGVLVVFSGNAHAFAYASEPTQILNHTAIEASNTLLTTQNSLTQTLVALIGEVPGTTVAGELASILGSLQGNGELANENVAEAGRRGRIKDAEQRYYDAEIQAMPNLKQCYDITQAAVRGGATAAGAQAARTTASSSVDVALTAKSDASSAGRIISNRSSLGTCSAADAAAGRTGCGSTGTMPSADVSASTFFQTATTDGGITNSNLSFPTQQQTLITGSGTNGDTLVSHLVTPFPAPVLPAAVEKTPQGLSYLALKFASALRLSTGSYALSQIIGMRIPDSSSQFAGTRTLTSGASAAWSTNQATYQRIFPKDKFPTVPSEMELLRFEAASRYVDAGPDSWAVKISTMNPLDLQKEQLKLQAYQADIQFKSYQRLEEGNAMLASLLAQSQYPITNSVLQAASQQALGSQHN